MNSLSPKQLKILAFPYSNYDALICDGAIRSGKTSIMTVAFVDWAMRNFKGCNFAICGKTVGSAVKNIITPYMALSYSNDRYSMRFNRAENKLTIKKGSTENYFYIYGGKDESSYMLIQGITLAGVILDEVALMVRSFVEQALARCSVEGSKFWFNCNPASPEHWFYLDWVLKAKEKNALHLHFLMNDNPSLSEKMLARYESLYTGVFYNRYIRGEWVIAEGLVFDYNKEKNEIQAEFDRDNKRLIFADGTEQALTGDWYLTCDYGITNPFVCQLWNVSYHNAICVSEYNYSSKAHNDRRKTDVEHYECIKDLANGLPITMLIIDPSASSMYELIRRDGLFAVRGAKNDVLGGIGHMSSYLSQGFLKYNKLTCNETIKEFGLYLWDSESGKDQVIKTNDHGMDASRYLCETILRRLW